MKNLSYDDYTMNLFDSLENNNKQIPLAELMRPKNLEDYLGQTNVINQNSPFYKLLMAKRLSFLLKWNLKILNGKLRK